MAVDYGDVRTGIALCDALEILASPVCVICESSAKKLAAQVAALAGEKKAEKIIVGLPKNMDGSIGFKAESCITFAEKLRNYTKIPVLMWDERLTTVAANKLLNQTTIKGQKRQKIIDAAAAVMILQSYIDSIKK